MPKKLSFSGSIYIYIYGAIFISEPRSIFLSAYFRFPHRFVDVAYIWALNEDMKIFN